jgi:cytochrome c553
MRTLIRIVLVVVVVLGAAVVATFLWAGSKSSAVLGRSVETHSIDFPVPFPLTEAEVEALRRERVAGLESVREGEDVLDGVDLEAVALSAAIERGRHLVKSRYSCTECHGQDFAGGVMIDDPMIGRLLGPNVTAGEGGVLAGYTVADWDRIVRHGVKRGGRPSAMPSQDFAAMSDRELSDIVAFVGALPPVDKEVPPVKLGPLGKVLVAAGALPLAYDLIADHQSAHEALPPAEDDTLAFGRHLAQVCTGCHRADFSGGPVAGGDPSWPPAANLTTHESGLSGWTFAQFEQVMREGRGRDGRPVRVPMEGVAEYGRHMTGPELQAMWAFLSSLPPVEPPK